MAHKHLRREHEALKVEHARIELRLEKLEDEAGAKDTYFQWISKIAQAGSVPSLPKSYLGGEAKKKHEIFTNERMYPQHLEMLRGAKMIESVLEDIGAAKAFSILAFSINEILSSMGLLSSRPDVIRTNGHRKFKLGNG